MGKEEVHRLGKWKLVFVVAGNKMVRERNVHSTRWKK